MAHDWGVYREGLSGVNLCFSTQDGVVSWLLRKAMKIPASHCMITFRSDALDTVLAMEVQGRGFVIVPWDKWKKSNKLIARYSLRLPEDRILLALNKIVARLGDAYDTFSLFGFFLLFWGGFSRNVTDSTEKLVCSEAVALFLHHAGLEVGDIGKVTPRDLMLLVESSPEVFSREEAIDGYDKVIEQARRWGKDKPIHHGVAPPQQELPTAGRVAEIGATAPSEPAEPNF